MANPYTIQDFFKQFPDDDACLDHLMMTRHGNPTECPKCGKTGHFSRLSKHPAYSCQWCGHHIHPMKGTPFENSRTPLQKWFFAMFMFTTTRNGVSAKEIQRQLGVTYKTAWRIGHKLREYMGWVDGNPRIGGPTGNIVEIDEVMIGGRDKMGKDDKTVVMGMLERKGDLVTRVVKNRRAFTLIPEILRYVRQGSRVATDELRSYIGLPEEGYAHGTVNHNAGECVRGPVHTNTIEAFWAWLQRGIGGTHVWVSEKHMPKYLGEFEFRFNLRNHPHLMFQVLLSAFSKAPPKS